MTSIDIQHSQALQAAQLLLKSSTKLAFVFIFLVLSACSGQDAATSASTNSASTSSKTTAQQTSIELAQNPAVLTLTAPAPNATQSGQIQAQSGI